MTTDNTAMLCPACKVALVMSERQNIEIDYCPKCRGVWLDRGELDKMVERSASQPTTAEVRREGRYAGGHHGYRRKSWLSEIFD